MASLRLSTTSYGGTATLLLWINRSLEALWLLAVFLVPLIFLGRDFGTWSPVLGSFELPKIVLLRLLVGLMSALWLLEWALRGRLPTGQVSNESNWTSRPRSWLTGVRS